MSLLTFINQTVRVCTDFNNTLPLCQVCDISSDICSVSCCV